MSKRKKRTPKNKSNILKTIAWILAILALVMASLAIGFMIGQDKVTEEVESKKTPQINTKLEILQKEEVLSKFESVNSRLKEVLKKETAPEENTIVKQEITKKIPKEVKTYGGASHEYVTEDVKKAPLRVKREVKHSSEDKPKLVIIMDDVSRKSHVNAIRNLGLNLTMSFLPPSAAIPNSAKLAAQEDFYMVHLPMEAQSYSAEEPKTLRVRNSQEEISSRIEEIKKIFPKVRYVNNHTGSRYTESQVAMNRLMVALNANNINFLDSRTTAKTKAPAVMKMYGLPYIARDVFLDHHKDKEYIIGQIKKAIQISKDEGVAIAIGHPRTNTILALHESKKFLKDVDLVLIDKIY